VTTLLPGGTRDGDLDVAELTDPRSPARPRDGLSRLAWSTGIVAAVVVLWMIGSAAGWWSPATLPAPRSVLEALREIVVTAEFRGDLWRTVSSVGVSLASGILAGGALGLAFWKVPGLGRAFEPYLVAFYAVPLVVFYPMMLVLVGINQWSIVILASLMAAVPMALNTWVGLNGVPPVYLKLARSLRCSPAQTLFRTALPAAAPLIFAGVRLAAVYAFIGVVAMEFVVAAAGLGFRIRYLYELFNQPGSFAYIVVVFALSGLLTALVTAVERRVDAHRGEAGGRR
jgi:NitT/TauT family transport system permease protein